MFGTRKPAVPGHVVKKRRPEVRNDGGSGGISGAAGGGGGGSVFPESPQTNEDNNNENSHPLQVQTKATKSALDKAHVPRSRSPGEKKRQIVKVRKVISYFRKRDARPGGGLSLPGCCLHRTNIHTHAKSYQHVAFLQQQQQPTPQPPAKKKKKY